MRSEVLIGTKNSRGDPRYTRETAPRLMRYGEIEAFRLVAGTTKSGRDERGGVWRKSPTKVDDYLERKMLEAAQCPAQEANANAIKWLWGCQ